MLTLTDEQEKVVRSLANLSDYATTQSAKANSITAELFLTDAVNLLIWAASQIANGYDLVKYDPQLKKNFDGPPFLAVLANARLIRDDGDASWLTKK